MRNHIARTASCVFVCLIGFTLAAGATLRIDRFDAAIRMTEEGALHVIEELTVTFATPHHGIERFIPVRYRNEINGVITTIDLEILNVQMDNTTVPLESRRSGSDRLLRIGDPDRTLLGTHVYRIEYRVLRALLFHDETVQLYWNVTGNEWSISDRFRGRNGHASLLGLAGGRGHHVICVDLRQRVARCPGQSVGRRRFRI